MNVFDVLSQCVGFDWDGGNSLKNWMRHGVSDAECEELFFNRPLVAFPDTMHSGAEIRFYALGTSNAGRHLFVVFTVRRDLIRVISARDMSNRERKAYKEHEKDSTIQV